jgi:hypothetical protein
MLFETDTDGTLDVTPTALTVAGWTGRDVAAVEHHIVELAALGVPAPSAVPLFYRCGAALLTQAGRIAVLGEATSGEAEPFLLRAQGRLWLGLGSDHTDRGLEATSVAHSKQVCPKPVANQLWAFDALADRLDTLELRSWIEEAGGWVLYQEGTLAAIRPLPDLLAAAPLAEGEAMLCGTLPALGGVRPGPRWRMALHDPARSRTLTLDYTVDPLPVRA